MKKKEGKEKRQVGKNRTDVQFIPRNSRFETLLIT